MSMLMYSDTDDVVTLPPNLVLVSVVVAVAADAIEHSFFILLQALYLILSFDPQALIPYMNDSTEIIS